MHMHLRTLPCVGAQVIVTTRLDVEAGSTVLPITYSRFTEMAVRGDTIYIGRYLVCGADSASLYLEVVDVQGEQGGRMARARGGGCAVGGWVGGR